MNIYILTIPLLEPFAIAFLIPYHPKSSSIRPLLFFPGASTALHFTTMISILSTLLYLPSLFTLTNAQDAAGYILPSSGQASTTQFLIGPEFGGGTACGLISLPGGAGLSGGAIGRGGGPGLLYAAINQLAFGANPSAGAGGPGGACGVCYTLYVSSPPLPFPSPPLPSLPTAVLTPTP
jgi:hypothetical protein